MPETLNGISAVWWDWMQALLWQTSLLVLLIFVFDRAFRRWAWPQLLYGLWLLAFVKLCLPPAMASPFSIVGMLTAEPPSASVVQITPLYSAGTAVVQPVAITPPFDWATLGFGVWLVGAIILGAWLWIETRRLRRKYLDGRGKNQTPEWLEPVLRRAVGRIGLRRIPAVVLADGIQSPAVLGVFRPVVLLPRSTAESFTDVEREHILLHELAHIKPGDLIVRGVISILLVINWINPLLWLAYRRVRGLWELCCDATVAAVLHEDTPAYRQTLLTGAQRLMEANYGLAVGFLGLVEDKSMIINRLKQLERRAWGSPRTRFAITVAALVVAAVTVLPMCGTAAVADRSVAPEIVVAQPPALNPTSISAPGAESSVEQRVVTESELRVPTSTSSVGSGTEPLEFWMVGQKPTILSPAMPVYPDSARSAGLEGEVIVEMIVDTDGKVESATILQGLPIFREAARKAAMQMVFTPGVHDGRPVRVKVAQQVRFRLNGPTAAQETPAEFWQVETKPAILSPAIPTYPDSAKHAGIEVDVIVEMVVGTDGKVESARILQGPPAFHEAARTAVMNMVFTPGMTNGQAVRVKVAQRISFRLDSSR
jgi:bla regulator protein BlaR1